jgi:hypothetical protein
MVTQQQVLDTFDSFGDQVVHSQALQSRMRGAGHDVDEIVTAINDAIKAGALSVDTMGQLRRP